MVLTWLIIKIANNKFTKVYIFSNNVKCFGVFLLFSCFLFDISWMMLQNFLSKGSCIDVGIDFCCTDAFVSQHGLDGTQIGSAFEQRGGNGMSQGVR